MGYEKCCTFAIQVKSNSTNIQHESVLLILADKSVATLANGMKVDTLRVIGLSMAGEFATFLCLHGNATHLIGKEIEAALPLLCSEAIDQ